MRPSHFIIGGAQRSATTYLTQALAAHPDIHFAQPMRPEPKWFLQADSADRGYAAYVERFFGAAKPGQVRGEKSTSYLDHPASAARI